MNFIQGCFNFTKKQTQVCLNIVATGLKQTGVYLGYTEYIQKNEDDNEDERLKAAEQRLIATGSLVNCRVATG